MKLKKLLVAVLVFSMIFALAACGDKDDNKPTPTKKDNGNNEGGISLTPQSDTIVAWLWFDDQENALINEFVREYPDLTIDNSERVAGVFDDHSTDLPRLSAAIASDEHVPDVFFSYITAIEAYYTDLFVPLQDYMDADQEFDIEEFDSQTFQTTTFNDIIYFIPFDYTTHIMGWNKTLYKNVGLDPESPPKTWSEYLEYCNKLTTMNTDGSLKTIGAYQDHFRWEIWQISASGENYVDNTGLKFNWDTDPFLQTFEFARKIGEVYGGEEKLGSGWWWMAFGNVAMGDLSAGGLSFVSDSAFEVGVTHIPRPDDKQDEFYAASYVDSIMGITRNAKNPAGAWKFIKFAVTDGHIAEQMQVYNSNPNSFVPTYLTHKPSRELLYTTFEGLLGEEKIEFIKHRDKLVEECNRAFYRAAIGTELKQFFDENYKKMLDYEMAPKDLILNLQQFCEKETANFIKDKEAEGWIFEEGKDGIPPSLQNKNN